ncbi:MAG: hypothetical protein MK105_17190 [Crocinitomicaceae bacterium]|nr:hypothetical protein [Crocinitomicaceae bacterium]
MVKSILILFIIIICFASAAQRMNEEVEITFGNIELQKSSKVIIVSAFKVDDGYIVLKKEPIRGPGGYHYFLEKFNEDLKSQNTHDISEQFEHDDFVIDGIIKVANSYILISTKDFADVRKEVLYGQTFDWESGELSEPQKIFTQKYEKKRGGINYDLKTSSDDQLMLLTIHPPTKKGEKEAVTFEVYDSELERLYSEEDVVFEEEDKNYSINETLLGDNGNIYLLGTKYTPRNRKLGIAAGPIENEIITISDGSQENTEIKFDKKIVDDISMTISEDGTLYVGGYYRVMDGIGIDGAFLFEINKETGEVDNELWDAFTREFITEGWSDRQVEKAKKKETKKGKDLGLSNLEFRSVIKHDDGSISMVGEVFWITYHTSTDANGNTSTRTVYHYGDLVASKISKEGEFVNHGRVKKHHTYFGAYEYFNLNNEVAVLFMRKRTALYDFDKETVTKAQKKEMAGLALVLAQIQEDGSVLETGIIDYRDEKYERYRKYKLIRREGHLIENDGSTEFMLLTYFGKKKWGICKLDFTPK